MKISRIVAWMSVAVSLLVAGCGGSDSEPSSAPTAAAPAAASNGGVTVSWVAPVQNEDGTPLVNLAGFRLRHGSRYGSYSNEITIQNPSATSHRVSGLAPGLYYFVVSAVDQRGLEGARSRPQRILVN
jgi:hypothetical protein